MLTSFESKPFAQIACDALVVPVFEDRPETLCDATELRAAGELTGKMLELTLLHKPAGLAAGRVLFAGAGKAAKFDPSVLRRLVGAAVRFLKERSLRSAALVLDGDLATPACAAAAIEGAILGGFDPDRYKTAPERKPLERFIVVGPAALEEPVLRAAVIAEAQNFTRSLVNEPSNRLTPGGMADAARDLASRFGLECEVLERPRLEELGMGALLGVAQGSSEPPCLIVLRYRPSAPVCADHLGLVGKGVTFDSGGISIKPSEGMEKMKYDMAGGAAMMGAMRALAQLRPPIAVSAFIPCVENMPGSHAQRPGDIVTSLSGKTIEVLNTDAEGRLILADALTYAIQQGCTHLVDAATLTGAVVVALGHVNVGLFASDEALRQRVLEAARVAGDRMWVLPLEDDYREDLKSDFADIANVGSRWGGAITAAIFLKEFAGDLPFVHLDIAGTAYQDESKPYQAKGPSGVPVRTLVELATAWSG
jgi:leucyl aminopeptidase